jgi:hypothetical protein
MYEFEALLFSDSVKMASGLKTNQDWKSFFGFIITQPLKTIKIIKRCYKIKIMYQSI